MTEQVIKKDYFINLSQRMIVIALKPLGVKQSFKPLTATSLNN